MSPTSYRTALPRDACRFIDGKEYYTAVEGYCQGICEILYEWVIHYPTCSALLRRAASAAQRTQVPRWLSASLLKRKFAATPASELPVI
jgi:hypothetical protein